MKIFVGMLVYDGKVPCEVVTCMNNEQIVARELGLDLRFNFIPSCSHAAMGRNQLARDFLKSDCDRLFFLDADVTWELGKMVELCLQPYDVVGGAYRYKCEEEKYPVNFFTNQGIYSNQHGLVKVQDLPGGFLAISRNALNKMIEAKPERLYDHYGEAAYCFFQFAFIDGKFYGEDTLFCKEWRDIGGDVYLDPKLNLTHWQFPVKYEGNIGQWMLKTFDQDRAKWPNPEVQ